MGSECFSEKARVFATSKMNSSMAENRILENLHQRNATFAHFTKTKDALHTVIITTYGLKRNLYSDSIYATVTMEGLFSEQSK
jgi:hypothetical protein